MTETFPMIVRMAPLALRYSSKEVLVTDPTLLVELSSLEARKERIATEFEIIHKQAFQIVKVNLAKFLRQNKPAKMTRNYFLLRAFCRGIPRKALERRIHKHTYEGFLGMQVALVNMLPPAYKECGTAAFREWYKADKIPVVRSRYHVRKERKRLFLKLQEQDEQQELF
jgi:hypothetical protein